MAIQMQQRALENASMTPIFHISLGRSGTTLSMRLLASHPQVVVNEKYPLEFRPAWSALFPDEADCRQELSHPHYRFDGWDETIGAALANGTFKFADALSGYRRLAESVGKSPRFFAEKAPWKTVVELTDKCPDARYSCIIRDPRDVLVSVRAFNAKRGYESFLAKQSDSDDTIVTNYLQAYETIKATIGRVNAAVIRYEDLMQAPVQTTVDLYRNLHLDASIEVASSAWERAQAMEDGSHRTSQVGELSRWRTELTPSLKDLYSTQFRGVIEHFGYPLD